MSPMSRLGSKIGKIMKYALPDGAFPFHFGEISVTLTRDALRAGGVFREGPYPTHDQNRRGSAFA
jgi:hypothetical protein